MCQGDPLFTTGFFRDCTGESSGRVGEHPGIVIIILAPINRWIPAGLPQASSRLAYGGRPP